MTMSKTAGGGGRRTGALRRFLTLGTAVAVLAACSVPSDPMSVADLRSQSKADLQKLFARQEPVSQPLTIHDVMARVLKYNLDNKLKVMEEALAQRQVDVADMSLLPRMATTAGYVSRSNESASSSKSITTGRQSLETSTSQDQYRRTSDLTMAWNILDFGVSYVGALQQRDRAMVAEERRRKVVHNILQDTRTVYWRAVAAQRLQNRIGPLMGRIDKALNDSRTINEMRLTSPVDALTYQKQLLTTRRQLLDLQKELQVAKSQLATLMDLPPATDVPLVLPKRGDGEIPAIKLGPEKIEEIALLRRPELVEEAYQARIGANETRKAMLRMLPGIELSVGMNFDSNSYLLYNRWADYGAKAVWNLFNVFTGPSNIALAEAQESFIETRRLALSMAVLTQSRVAWLRYRQALDGWKVARDLEKVERGLAAQMRDEVAAEKRGELAGLQSAFDALLAELSADLAFAETQNAAGNILVSMGFDPLPGDLKSDTLSDIAAALKTREQDWFSGRIQLEPPAAEKPAAVAETPSPAVDAKAAETKPAEVKPVDVKPVEPVKAVETPAPATKPEPVAAVAGGYQVSLGTYAGEKLAAAEWGDLVARNPRLTTGLSPAYVTTTRRSDGKTFTILRAAGFQGSNEASRFCDALSAASRECVVKAPNR